MRLAYRERCRPSIWVASILFTRTVTKAVVSECGMRPAHVCRLGSRNSSIRKGRVVLFEVCSEAGTVDSVSLSPRPIFLKVADQAASLRRVIKFNFELGRCWINFLAEVLLPFARRHICASFQVIFFSVYRPTRFDCYFSEISKPSFFFLRSMISSWKLSSSRLSFIQFFVVDGLETRETLYSYISKRVEKRVI